MPIYVTVTPNEDTHAECLIYTTGTPMLAVHDPSATVMVTMGQQTGGSVQAARFAAELVRAGQQFEHEARRFAGFATAAPATSPEALPATRSTEASWPQDGGS